MFWYQVAIVRSTLFVTLKQLFFFFKKKKPTKEQKDILEVMDKFSNLMVVMASQMYAYVQTHQNVYIKCVIFYI